MRDAGLKIRAILVDQDPIALAAAQSLAEKPPFELADSIELHCRRLFSATGAALELDPVIRGRRIAIVEDTGLRECLPTRVDISLTRALRAELDRGGTMSTGNTITHRPQAGLLHGLTGREPTVVMRTIRRGLDLHEASGLPRGVTRAHVSVDGVYAVYVSPEP